MFQTSTCNTKNPHHLSLPTAPYLPQGRNEGAAAVDAASDGPKQQSHTLVHRNSPAGRCCSPSPTVTPGWQRRQRSRIMKELPLIFRVSSNSQICTIKAQPNTVTRLKARSSVSANFRRECLQSRRKSAPLPLHPRFIKQPPPTHTLSTFQF